MGIIINFLLDLLVVVILIKAIIFVAFGSWESVTEYIGKFKKKKKKDNRITNVKPKTYIDGMWRINERN